MNGKCTKVVLIAILNLLLVYYVVFNGSLQVDKKYVTDKFQARLPKDSQQVGDTVEDDSKNAGDKVEDEESTLKPSPTSHNPLIELMKNKLFELKENGSSITKSDKNITLEETNISLELKERLSDSSEIVLVTNPIPVMNPKLYIQSKVINNLKDFYKLMEERVDLLRNHCQHHKQSYGMFSSQVNSQYLYVLQSHALVWCPVYKAASTNWCHNLLLLAGKTEKEVKEIILKHPNQPNDQARVVAPHISQMSLKTTLTKPNVTTLLIVRHPFDRLVSAFRDKLEQCHGLPENCTLQSNWYYKQYGKKIVGQWRTKAIAKFGEQYFSESNNYGAPFPVNRSWRDAHYPSWWEFVRYLLSNSANMFDEHWKPASLYCTVCGDMKYNTILHFENIDHEEPWLADTLGAGNVIEPRWENKNSKNISKEKVLGSYFSLLTDEEITGLYNIYKDDFKAFGYKFQFRNLSFG